MQHIKGLEVMLLMLQLPKFQRWTQICHCLIQLKHLIQNMDRGKKKPTKCASHAHYRKRQRVIDLQLIFSQDWLQHVISSSRGPCDVVHCPLFHLFAFPLCFKSKLFIAKEKEDRWDRWKCWWHWQMERSERVWQSTGWSKKLQPDWVH